MTKMAVFGVVDIVSYTVFAVVLCDGRTRKFLDKLHKFFFGFLDTSMGVYVVCVYFLLSFFGRILLVEKIITFVLEIDASKAIGTIADVITQYTII